MTSTMTQWLHRITIVAIASLVFANVPTCMADAPNPATEKEIEPSKERAMKLEVERLLQEHRALIARQDPKVQELANSTSCTVAFFARRHFDPLLERTNESAGEKETVVRPVLAMTRLVDRYALLYDVSAKGKVYSVRDKFPHGVGSEWERQLSDRELTDVCKLLQKLPKATDKPGTDRTVIISFERDKKWCTEVYDSSSLPESLEGVLRIIEKRGETKDRQRPK